MMVPSTEPGNRLPTALPFSRRNGEISPFSGASVKFTFTFLEAQGASIKVPNLRHHVGAGEGAQFANENRNQPPVIAITLSAAKPARTASEMLNPPDIHANSS